MKLTFPTKYSLRSCLRKHFSLVPWARYSLGDVQIHRLAYRTAVIPHHNSWDTSTLDRWDTTKCFTQHWKGRDEHANMDLNNNNMDACVVMLTWSEMSQLIVKRIVSCRVMYRSNRDINNPREFDNFLYPWRREFDGCYLGGPTNTIFELPRSHDQARNHQETTALFVTWLKEKGPLKLSF